MKSEEFLTYLARPWDRLNELLRHPLAFQTDLNDPLRDAANIAVYIRHIPENEGIPQAVAQAESSEHDILIDVGDASKHGLLRDATRNNTLSIGSRFEVLGPDQFRFMRSVITVKHASKGAHDLMALALGAIAYWRLKLGIALPWAPGIKEADPVITNSADLSLNLAHQASFKTVELQFVRRDENGQLVPCDTDFTFRLHRV